MEEKDNNTTICPNCSFEYDKKEKSCPNCNYKSPLDLDKTFWIFIILLLPITLFYLINENSYKFISIKNLETKFYKEINTNLKEIKLNPMEDFSYLSKEEILNKRIEKVKNSPYFSDIKDYQPNPEVYQIEDNLPWIAIEPLAKYGIDKAQDISKGISRQSISILNPELLITLNTPSFSHRDSSKFSKYDYFYPKKVLIDKKGKIIESYYDISNFYKINPNYIALEIFPDDANARDFGYNWAWAYKHNNISFIDNYNGVHIRPYQLKGFYHKGFSCKLKSGCNNYSPHQPQLNFRILQTGANIEFKLWTKKPKSIKDKQDITYRMIFE